jgi:hypothetical protein
VVWSRRAFFSYARPDRAAVAQVSRRLGDGGYVTFFDQAITGGHRWWDEILTELEACDIFIPVLSEHYVLSDACSSEAEYAIQLLKPLVPLKLDLDLDPTLVITPLRLAQWIDYRSDQLLDTMMSLVSAINKAPDAPALPSDRQRPPPPGEGILDDAVRLINKAGKLSEEEQTFVVGQLTIAFNGPKRDTVVKLVGRFVRRDGLLATVRDAAEAMLHAAASVAAASEPI